ncbi:MAG: chitobiase/beta-hexosaminidase C-terminal domain-containing protein [Candidatus Saccharimonadales bacterium]
MTHSHVYKAVRETKTKFINITTSLILVGMSLGGAIPALLPATAHAAGNTVVVTPSNATSNGWTEFTQDGSSVDYVADSDPQTTGNGALRITTANDNNSVADYYRENTSVPLSSIQQLGYSTKQLHGPVGSANPSYYMGIDADGNSSTSDTFYVLYETYYNDTNIANQWQNWSINNDTGKFWSTAPVGSLGSNGGGSAAKNFTLGNLKSAYPNATVVEYGLNMGTGNPDWSSEVDNFNFNGTTYNFEPAAPVQTCSYDPSQYSEVNWGRDLATQNDTPLFDTSSNGGLVSLNGGSVPSSITDYNTTHPTAPWHWLYVKGTSPINWAYGFADGTTRTAAVTFSLVGTCEVPTITWGGPYPPTIGSSTIYASAYYTSAHGYPASGCNRNLPVPRCETIQDAINAAKDGDTIKLIGNFDVSQQINVNKEVTIDGMGGSNNYIAVIYANFDKTDNSNNSVLSVTANHVRISQLIVNGKSRQLHGINTYNAQDLQMWRVTLENNGFSGLNVNRSWVQGVDLTTENNGWHGVDVDGPGAVFQDAGINHHNETGTHTDNSKTLPVPALYVDDTTVGTVNDTNNQYVYVNNYWHNGDRAYFLASEAPDFSNAKVNGASVALQPQNCSTSGFKLVSGTMGLSTDISDGAGTGIDGASYRVVRVGTNGCIMTNPNNDYGNGVMGYDSGSQTLTGPNTFTGSFDTKTLPSDGNYAVMLTAKNALGLTTTNYIDINVDNTGPEYNAVTINDNPFVDGMLVHGNISIGTNFNDTSSGVQKANYFLRKDSNASKFGGSESMSQVRASDTWKTTSNFNTKDLNGYGDGTYELRLHVWDNLGNLTSVKVGTINVDNTAPDAPTASFASNGDGTQNVTLTKSNITDTIYYTIGGSTPTIDPANKYTGPFSLNPSVAPNVTTIKAVAIDAAGNVSLPMSVNGPAITNEASQTATTTAITLTWNTNEPATSRVVYDTVSHSAIGTGNNYGYANSTLEDSTLNTAHSVTITGLTPGTTYYFRIASHGSPETVSSQITGLTLVPPTPGAPASQPPVFQVALTPPNNQGIQVLGASTTTPANSGNNGSATEVLGDSATRGNDQGTVNIASSANKSGNNFLGLGWWWLLILAVIAGFFWFFAGKRDKDDDKKA